MRRILMGAFLAIAITACAKNPVQSWDQMHITYNAAASSAMSYANLEATNPTTAKLIADIVIRTTHIIEQASHVADQPQTEDTERYLKWARVVVSESLTQLEAYLIERAADKSTSIKPDVTGTGAI